MNALAISIDFKSGWTGFGWKSIEVKILANREKRTAPDLGWAWVLDLVWDLVWDSVWGLVCRTLMATIDLGCKHLEFVHGSPFLKAPLIYRLPPLPPTSSIR